MITYLKIKTVFSKKTDAEVLRDWIFKNNVALQLDANAGQGQTTLPKSDNLLVEGTIINVFRIQEGSEATIKQNLPNQIKLAYQQFPSLTSIEFSFTTDETDITPIIKP